jgi:hypothetical protein
MQVAGGVIVAMVRNVIEKDVVGGEVLGKTSADCLSISIMVSFRRMASQVAKAHPA